MRRTSTMTLGFLLIFIGIQLNLVETYVLTPRVSNFLTENGGSRFNTNASVINPAGNGIVNVNPQFNRQPGIQNTPYNSPYYQASFPQAQSVPQFEPIANVGPAKTFSPSKWLCWPVLFFGAVLLLQGFSLRRS